MKNIGKKSSCTYTEKTTVKLSKHVQRRMRDACDDRGMRMLDFADQLLTEALKNLETGEIVVPQMRGR